MHIPFVSMVKFKFLAHFPVDHLVDPAVSCLMEFKARHGRVGKVIHGEMCQKFKFYTNSLHSLIM